MVALAQATRVRDRKPLETETIIVVYVARYVPVLRPRNDYFESVLAVERPLELF